MIHLRHSSFYESLGEKPWSLLFCGRLEKPSGDVTEGYTAALRRTAFRVSAPIRVGTLRRYTLTLAGDH